MKVFTANISPVRSDNGGEIYVLEARLDRFNEYINELADLLSSKEILDKLSRVIKEVKGVQGLAKALRLINDLIVTYFKRTFTAPLSPPPRKGSAYVLTYQDLLYAYMICRDIGLESSEDAVREFFNAPLQNLKAGLMEKFAESLFRNLGKVFTKVFEVKELRRVYEDFTDIVMGVPADTRPGLNTSKLIPHLLMTSAMASVKYLSKYGRLGKELEPIRELELEVLRAAALMHDVGKPASWVKRPPAPHSQISAEIAERVLNALMLAAEGLGDAEAVAGRVIEAVSELIRRHHSPREAPEAFRVGSLTINLNTLVTILSNADKASSASERLLEESVKVMSQSNIIKSKRLSLEEVREALKGTGPKAWSFWERFSDDEIKSLSEEVAKELSLKDLKAKAPEILKDVAIIGLDIRGIQKFIRRESLKAVAAASTFVEMASTYVLPKALLLNTNAPLETIITAGGGNVLALTPSWLTDELIERIAEEVKKKTGLTVTGAVVRFKIPWLSTYRELFSRIKARKLAITKQPITTDEVFIGYEAPCESCRRRPAAYRDRRGDLLCDECVKLLEFGKSAYISYKLRMLEGLGYPVSQYLGSISEVYENLMNWLSGSRDYVSRGRYVAVIKIDGNAIGSYMAQALTPVEAYLRSIRVDLGVKLGLHLFFNVLSSIKDGLELLDDLSGEDVAVRTYGGILYAGGDDLLAIVPSAIALPLTFSVAYWFWRATGTRTISAGISCGKPRHNIWLLIDTANKLLSKSKELCRRLGRRGDSLLYVGIELGTQQVTPSMVDESERIYGGLGLNRMPSRVAMDLNTDVSESVALALRLIIGTITAQHLSKLSNYNVICGFVKALLKADISRLKEIRSSVSELLTRIVSRLNTVGLEDLWNELAVWLTWSACRKGASDPSAELYSSLASVMLSEAKNGKKMLPPVRDLLLVLNAFLGGQR